MDISRANIKDILTTCVNNNVFNDLAKVSDGVVGKTLDLQSAQDCVNDSNLTPTEKFFAKNALNEISRMSQTSSVTTQMLNVVSILYIPSTK